MTYVPRIRGEHVLVSPRAWLVCVASTNLDEIGHVVMPLLITDSEGNRVVGPGTDRPLLRWEVFGFLIEGRGEIVEEVFPGDRVSGIAWVSPVGYVYTTRIENVVGPVDTAGAR